MKEVLPIEFEEFHSFLLSSSQCVSDNDSVIVYPMQPTELRCEHLQCSVLEKLNPQI